MSIFITLGVILGVLGGGALLLKAPSISSPSVSDVSRETMIENIRSEFEDVIPGEKEPSSIPGIVSPPTKPLGINKKKDTLDMLYKDISSGIKNHDSSEGKNDDKENKKSSVKPLFGVFSSLFNFFSKGIGFLLFLLGVLVSLFMLLFKREKK